MSRLEEGTYINDRYTAIEDRLKIVRKRLNRPLSFSEKVTPELQFCKSRPYAALMQAASLLVCKTL